MTKKVFPASAGVILKYAIIALCKGSFPRIRGGDPIMRCQ